MELVDWVNEGRPSIVTAEHARHVIEIIEAAYRSAETGEAQELRTILEPEPAREPNPGRSDGGNDA
jgi:hypothetical protein